MFNSTAVWDWVAAELHNLKLRRISLILHLPPPKDQRPRNLQGQTVKASSDFTAATLSDTTEPRSSRIRKSTIVM